MIVQKNKSIKNMLDDMEIERIGKGKAKGHFGEYIQGYFDDIDGDKNDRASVSVPLKYNNQTSIDDFSQIDHEYYQLPFATVGSSATFIPSDNQKLEIIPDSKIAAKKAVELTFKILNKTDIGGKLIIETQGDMSQGLGTSTSDIVAAIRAVCDSYSLNISNEQIAQISVAAEKASDGIMYEHPALFITTQGRIIEKYSGYYPKFEILGFKATKDINGVNTLDIPPRIYNSEEKKQLRILRAALRKAFLDNNKDLLGRVAICSAKINQRFLEKPYLKEIIELACDNKSKGVVIAHSGTMIGLLFSPEKMPLNRNLTNIIESLNSLGFNNLRRYISE